MTALTRHLAKPRRTLSTTGRPCWSIYCPDCGYLGITAYSGDEALEAATAHYRDQLRKAPRPIP